MITKEAVNMNTNKHRYPGTAGAEKERTAAARRVKHEQKAAEEPDFIGNAPNWDKFYSLGWDAEKTLVWLNID